MLLPDICEISEVPALRFNPRFRRWQRGFATVIGVINPALVLRAKSSNWNQAG